MDVGEIPSCEQASVHRLFSVIADPEEQDGAPLSERTYSGLLVWSVDGLSVTPKNYNSGYFIIRTFSK